MSDLAIRVEGLGKRFQIAHSQARSRYKTLQEDLLTLPGRIWSAARGNGAGHETFWALRDVSFDVKQGEVLGIIGRNGAGKSTLLKILAGITEPTAGRAEIYGRVGSLLEVGTGFHQELTGRENIYLSGAILGMTHREVQRKFDEIVAFAGVDKFVDTPAKHYSSGMYMRLAFAVAAHLEPEILLVDEVLAVGDAEFQKKCLGKMGEVAQAGRTVLFVSHNLPVLQRLCEDGLWLDGGRSKLWGSMQAALSAYGAARSELNAADDLRSRADRLGDGALRFTGVTILDQDVRPLGQLMSGQDVVFRLHYESKYRQATRAQVNVAFNVATAAGELLVNLNSKDTDDLEMCLGAVGHFDCHWSHFSLRSGTYRCDLYCAIDGSVADWIKEAFEIYVDDGDYYGTGSLAPRREGHMLVPYDWTFTIDDNLPA